MKFAGWMTVILCLLVAGCAIPPTPPDQVPQDKFWHPNLLYLLDSPYRKMAVEVDAVKGCEPNDATLKQLHDFLAAYCDKPDGIQIFRGSVIPKAAVRGMSAETVAARFVRGPPLKPGDEQPAFAQLLFYDSTGLSAGKTHDTGHGSSLLLDAPPPSPRNPQTESLPYPSVILMNDGYFVKQTHPDLLRHEAGHLLGLVHRTNNAIPPHCADPNCLMYPTLHVDFHLRRFFLGDGVYTFKHPQLCTNCLAELAKDRKASPATNLHFFGPVLVRSEGGYNVLTLPARVEVLVGPVSADGCRDFLKAIQARQLLPGDDDAHLDIDDTVFADKKRTKEILSRAGKDPLDLVRAVTVAACVHCGFYDLAVDICKKEVKSSSAGLFFYQNLAWIEAACPGEKYRNGRDAVANATRACEMSGWKNKEFVATLAAAQAESGNFEKAIQLQSRVVREMSKTDPARGEMAERLKLFKQSKPYRDMKKE